MRILYITCNHSKEDYYETFSALQAIEDRKNVPNVSWWKNHTKTFESSSPNNPSKIEIAYINNIYSNKEFYEITDYSFHPDTTIVLSILPSEKTSQDDIYCYKFFSLLKKRFFSSENRIIFFNYNKTEIFKIVSYLLFEYIYTDNVFCLWEEKEYSTYNLPYKIAPSREWLPIIPLNSAIFEILKTGYPLSQLLDVSFTVSSNGLIDLSKFITELASKNFYLTYFKILVSCWINKHPEIKLFLDDNKSKSIPLLSLLIFILQYMKNQVPKKNDSELEKLLDVSCDYGEGLLQLAENVLYHSQGGVLSVRLNDNKHKIEEYFDKKYYKDNEWYLRMSISDYSNNTIIDNIKLKGNIENLNLADVFFQNKNEKYLEYLNKSSNLIHHYGLMTFSQIVSQNNGFFTVTSALNSKNKKYNFYTGKGKNPGDTKAVLDEDFFRHHIPGTDYDIFLPIYSLGKEEQINYLPSIPLNQILYHEKLEKYKAITKKINYFQDGEQKNSFRELQKNFKQNDLNEQEKKEKIIENAVSDLQYHISAKKGDSKDIFVYFNVKNCKYKRIEAICKIIMGLIIKFADTNNCVHFILLGFDSNTIIAFVRQFALFYRNNYNDYMTKSQIFLQTEDGLTDVLLLGPNLKSSYDYNVFMQLKNGLNSTITNNLQHVANRYFSILDEDYSESPPITKSIDFESLPEYYIENNEIKKGPPLFYKKLYKVVTTDIHTENLGCKIPEIHIKANRVHLQEFYEAQILFGNAYWCSQFSNLIYEEIVDNNKIDKKIPIVLYGYENYSETMLFSIKEKLLSKGYDCVYIVYENSKYITPDSKSEIRIRYSELLDNKRNCDKLQIIPVIGISTTTKTLETMKTKLKKVSKHLFEKFIFNDAFIIFHITDPNHPLEQDTSTHSTPFMTINSKWDYPNECQLCFPEDNYLKEKFLINTNETSTIPTLLIKPNKRTVNSKSETKYLKKYTDIFLKNTSNKKYLYYSHINRGGNHYQYYLRTATLLSDELNNYHIERGIGAWFNDVKNSIKPNHDKLINILVCPAHFSNQTFATAVNRYVFDNNAYLINFDVHKEYRGTFEAKYSNYLAALQLITNKMKSSNVTVHFHYVDDQIITGDTFQRAKTLVYGLVNKMHLDSNISESKREELHRPRIFQNIITLIDRNSNSSRQNYFDFDLEAQEHFYSYLRFKTPSIRSYGDSCPLCKKVSNAKRLSKEASLTFISEYWSDKTSQHQLHPITEIKGRNLDVTTETKLREFRRLQCSEEVWKNIDNISSRKYLADDIIFNYLKALETDTDKIEYLISFFKICSREHIIFQENTNNYIFQILLDSYSLFTNNPTEEKNDIELYKWIYDFITKTKDDKLNRGLVYDLYCIIITRLCSLGSNWLIDENRLLECYDIGETWFCEDSFNQKQYINKSELKNAPSNFGEFLAIQIKKSLFVTDNPQIKTQKLNEILKNLLRHQNGKEE